MPQCVCVRKLIGRSELINVTNSCCNRSVGSRTGETDSDKGNIVDHCRMIVILFRDTQRLICGGDAFGWGEQSISNEWRRERWKTRRTRLSRICLDRELGHCLKTSVRR